MNFSGSRLDRSVVQLSSYTLRMELLTIAKVGKTALYDALKAGKASPEQCIQHQQLRSIHRFQTCRHPSAFISSPLFGKW